MFHDWRTRGAIRVFFDKDDGDGGGGATPPEDGDGGDPKGDGDTKPLDADGFEDWVKAQGDEAWNAYTARNEKLEGALKKERAHARDVERESLKNQEKAAENATKKAEEAKLLEDGNKDELLIRAQQERDAATQKLEELERTDNVNRLLDVEQVVNADLRSLFHRIKTDGLEDLKKVVDDVKGLIASEVETAKGTFDDAVQAEVEKRLATNQPPKKPPGSPPGGATGPITQRSQITTTADKVAFVSEHGRAAFEALDD